LSVSEEGEGHVFASPSTGFMSLICFVNGSLAREKVREQVGLSWEEYEESVANTKPGNGGKIMLPYFDEEITPMSQHAQVYRFGLEESDGAANCRAVLEAQFMSMRLHSSWMPKPKSISVTGGASQNKTILQIIANVFGAEVKRLKTTGGAGLGAALRAYQADTQLAWQHIFENFIEYDEEIITPDALANSLYEDLLKVYAQCELFSIADGKDPEADRREFINRWK
jgi:xylulokinase